MIALTDRKLIRTVTFVAFNAFVLFFLVAFVVAPVLAHFSDRGDDISENTTQLAHFQSIMRTARVLVTTDPKAGEPFFAGREDRVVSADLQANLMSVAKAAGVRLLGVRGLQGHRSRHLHMVVVSAELEGSPPAIRDMIQALENQTPLLFVSGASLRSITDGDGGPIRAELKVQGAMRDNEPSAEQAVLE
jgi:general secretion pathway protein M